MGVRASARGGDARNLIDQPVGIVRHGDVRVVRRWLEVIKVERELLESDGGLVPQAGLLCGVGLHEVRAEG